MEDFKRNIYMKEISKLQELDNQIKEIHKQTKELLDKLSAKKVRIKIKEISKAR